MSREISAEYIAGFFDGEGSVSIHKGNRLKPNDWRMAVQISQVDGPVLFFLHGKFGGYLKNITRKTNFVKSAQPIWRWQVSLRKAEAFLRWIDPHVVIKRKQVDLALKFMKSRKPQARPWKHDEGDTRGYEAMALEMRKNNRKGGNHDSNAEPSIH